MDALYIIENWRWGRPGDKSALYFQDVLSCCLFLALQQSCVHKFRKWLSMAPLPIKREDDSIDQEDTQEGPYARVVSCAYIPDK